MKNARNAKMAAHRGKQADRNAKAAATRMRATDRNVKPVARSEATIVDVTAQTTETMNRVLNETMSKTASGLPETVGTIRDLQRLQRMERVRSDTADLAVVEMTIENRRIDP